MVRRAPGGLHLFGNTTMAFAMYRLAVASGWTLSGPAAATRRALYARLTQGVDVEAVETETPSW